MPVIKARLRLSLDIVANEVIPDCGSLPYSKRTPAEQHIVKMKLLRELSVPVLLDWLDVWNRLTIKVDQEFQDSVPTVPRLLQRQFDLAREDLEAGVGYALEVGLLCNGQPCTKSPDCSHDCRHLYQTVQAKTDGTPPGPWIVEFDGVQAWVITSLEWTTAKLAVEDADDDHDHDDKTDEEQARAAAAGAPD